EGFGVATQQRSAVDRRTILSPRCRRSARAPRLSPTWSAPASAVHSAKSEYLNLSDSLVSSNPNFPTVGVDAINLQILGRQTFAPHDLNLDIALLLHLHQVASLLVVDVASDLLLDRYRNPGNLADLAAI